MSIFGANISLLNKFLNHFTSCFSKKQVALFTLAIYALFKDYKRNSLEAMAFVSPAKHFPHDIIPYLPARELSGGETNPQGKDTIQMAKELFDKSLGTLDFSAVTFDSWYAAPHFLEHIHAHKKLFFSEIKSNRNIFMFPPTKKHGVV